MAFSKKVKNVYAIGRGKGGVLFTGPDGICDHQVNVEEPTYVGIGTMSPEGTSELSYLWRAAMTTQHPIAKSKVVGEIGWNISSYKDPSLLKSGKQLKRGEFHQLGEDRHTHLYQNPWNPHPESITYKTDRYGREILHPSNLIIRNELTSTVRCQCLAGKRQPMESNLLCNEKCLN